MDRSVALLVLLHVSQHALGVEVYVGQDSVVLPFHVDASVSDRSTVVWDRKDLKKENIHIRQLSGDDFTEQNPNYANRTSMRTNALQTGDLSLTLRNPTVSDSGTYTCTIRRFGIELNSTDVQLQVTEPPPVWAWILLGLLVPLFLLGAGFGVIAILANKAMKDRLKHQLKVVEVTQGAANVNLPCTTSVELGQDIAVEWRRSVPHYKIIHVYENGSGHAKGDYEDRTMMIGNPTEGNLTLNLKNPQLDDGGVYICTIYEDQKIVRQKIVVLSVRETWTETIRGLFPCTKKGRDTPDPVPQRKREGREVEEPENQALTQSHV